MPITRVWGQLLPASIGQVGKEKGRARPRLLVGVLAALALAVGAVVATPVNAWALSSVNQFVATYTGQKVGDGECVTLVKQAILEIHGTSPAAIRGNAIDYRQGGTAGTFLNNNGFTWSTDSNLVDGDILVWGDGAYTDAAGHVAIAYGGQVFHQNFPKGSTARTHAFFSSAYLGRWHKTTPAGPPAGTSNGGQRITNTTSGRCLDVSGGTTANGVAVQLYDCNETPAQAWVVVGTSLRVYGNQSRCLDIKDGAFVPGTRIQIWDCSSANSNQTWSIRSDGTIRSQNGLCLDAVNGAKVNGTPIQLWTCTENNLAQQWAGPAFDNGGMSIRNPISGRCVDVPGATSSLGASIQLADCNGTGAQHWIRAGSTFRVYGNECLDIDSGKIASGTRVQLWQCSNNNNAQYWSVMSDGTIRSKDVNLCLEAKDGGTGNGTTLRIGTCVAGKAAQQWSGAPVDAIQPLTATPTPTIQGSAVVGGKLSASPGEWQPSPVTLSYAWHRSGTAIPGATNSSYSPVSADLGNTLTVVVTGTKSGFATTSRTSSATAAVIGGSPSPSPTATVSTTS